MRKDKVLTFRLPKYIKKIVEKQARKKKLSLSNFLVYTILKECKIKYVPEQYIVSKLKRNE